MNPKKKFLLDWRFPSGTAAGFVWLALISCIAPLLSGCNSPGGSAAACCCGQPTVHHSRAIACPLPPTAILPAAPESVEGQLLSRGLHWRQTDGPIVPGSYVEDILKDRLHQPSGRGFIGKIISVTDDAAMVDFGRDYAVGIFLRELRPISLEERS